MFVTQCRRDLALSFTDMQQVKRYVKRAWCARTLTVNYPDNKKATLARGGGLHSQLVGHYRRAVSTKYPICYRLKLLLVLTGNSRGGQILTLVTRRRATLPTGRPLPEDSFNEIPNLLPPEVTVGFNWQQLRWTDPDPCYEEDGYTPNWSATTGGQFQRNTPSVTT